MLNLFSMKSVLDYITVCIIKLLFDVFGYPCTDIVFFCGQVLLLLFTSTEHLNTVWFNTGNQLKRQDQKIVFPYLNSTLSVLLQ